MTTRAITTTHHLNGTIASRLARIIARHRARLTVLPYYPAYWAK